MKDTMNTKTKVTETKEEIGTKDGIDAKNTAETGIIGHFSVALGLFDYINPIFYSITAVTILCHMHGVMNPPAFAIFIAGAFCSLLFGFTIPTVKLLVGLGKMEFKMPVNLVSFVNTGLLLSGLALSGHVLGISPAGFAGILCAAAAVIGFLWYKTGRFNTAAVLIGAVGYILIYVSLIALSIRAGKTTPVMLFAAAIIFFVGLCLIGIKANLKNANVHWVIETCNVLCQCFVAIGTVILFL